MMETGIDNRDQEIIHQNFDSVPEPVRQELPRIGVPVAVITQDIPSPDPSVPVARSTFNFNPVAQAASISDEDEAEEIE